MLEVPTRTLGGNASWKAERWSTSWTLSRASDWVNYDRLALAEDLAAPPVAGPGIVGSQLRRYWREYEGVTRLRATFTRGLPGGLTFLLSGDNLLGRQRGEPDNVTIVPGRTIAGGLRARF
jgi:iron complex outermembrane receptor protein